MPAILIGLASFCPAEERKPEGPPPRPPFHRPPDPEKLKQDLHQRLHLRPEQEAAWQEFASQWKPPPPPPGREGKSASAPQRMEEHLKHLQAMEAHLKVQLEVVKKFYAQLSPEQQTIFDLMQPGPPRRP